MINLVLGKKIRTSDASHNIVGVQPTNGTVHGGRAVRAGVDFGSRDRTSSDGFYRARRHCVRILLHDGRHQSGHRNGLVSGT